MEAIKPLPWYPKNLAWHSNFSRKEIRKNKILERCTYFTKHFECFFVTLVIFPVWLKRLCVAHDCFFRFHEFLKLENEVGNMTRQEAVSMV